MARRRVFELIGNSPTTVTTVVASMAAGLLEYDHFMLDASLTGVVSGTLDVYLQREVADDVWADWAHFPTVTAGAAAIHYSAQAGKESTLRVVGLGTDAAPGTPALPVNVWVGGHPGNKVRVVFVTGSGATGPAKSQKIRLTGWNAD